MEAATVGHPAVVHLTPDISHTAAKLSGLQQMIFFVSRRIEEMTASLAALWSASII